MHVRRGQLCWGEEHHSEPVCWKANVVVGPQRSQDKAAEELLPYNGIFHFNTKSIFARKKIIEIGCKPHFTLFSLIQNTY